MGKATQTFFIFFMIYNLYNFEALQATLVCSFRMPALDDTARQVPGSKINPLRLNRHDWSRDV